jgi:hypothetical protein
MGAATVYPAVKLFFEVRSSDCATRTGLRSVFLGALSRRITRLFQHVSDMSADTVRGHPLPPN